MHIAYMIWSIFNDILYLLPVQFRVSQYAQSFQFFYVFIVRPKVPKQSNFSSTFTVYVQVLQNITSQYPITIAPRKSLFLLLCKSANNAQRHGQIWKQHYQISFKKLSKFLQKITSCSFVCISAGQNRIVQKKLF